MMVADEMRPLPVRKEETGHFGTSHSRRSTDAILSKRLWPCTGRSVQVSPVSSQTPGSVDLPFRFLSLALDFQRPALESSSFWAVAI